MSSDRGEQLGWFSSLEILLEAVVALSAIYLFLVHTFTAKAPLISLKLFKKRNFALSVVFIFIIGITYLASLALMTPCLQNLMSYPVLRAGVVMDRAASARCIRYPDLFIAGSWYGPVQPGSSAGISIVTVRLDGTPKSTTPRSAPI